MNYDIDTIQVAIANARDWAELERLKIPARHLLGREGVEAINARKKELFLVGQAGPSTVRYQTLDYERLTLAVTIAAEHAVITLGSLDALTPDILKRVARHLPIAALGGVETYGGTQLPSYNALYYALNNAMTLQYESGEMAADMESVPEIPDVLPAYIRDWLLIGREITREVIADPGKISVLVRHIMLALEHVCADV